MGKQRRFRSEAQIERAIDSARKLEQADVAQIAMFRDKIQEGRRLGKEHIINHAKGMIDLTEKRINRRAKRVERLKFKLSEFRTLTLPGLGELMEDKSIAQ